MCCLKHEEETYEELNRRLPNTGDYVTTDDGLKGEVSVCQRPAPAGQGAG